MELPDGGGAFLPLGWSGVLAALPFAVWLFLAIEELPLAAEESADPKQDMPKGLIFGMSTLMVSALMIMFLNASIGSPEQGKLHGAFSLATSAEPLLDGFRVIYGDELAKLLSLFAVIGLIASFHTIIFAFGRQIYSLSRAGYYPAVLSITHGTRKAPHMALFTGAALGLRDDDGRVVRARRREGRRGHRRDAAQHGGVRRDDLVRVPGTVVHPAAREHAEHRAAVPQPAGHSRRGGDGGHRAA